LVAALPPGTVVRGAGRRDGEREALAASLRRAGLVDVTLSGDDRGARFVATRGGTATEKAETVPENQEGDVRPLVAEETEPDPLEVPAPQGLKARLRALAAARLPEGTRSREVAKAALTTYREAIMAAARVREAWAIPGALEPREPSYTAFLRRHESPRAGAERAAAVLACAPTSRPACTSWWSAEDGAGPAPTLASWASRPGSSGRRRWSGTRSGVRQRRPKTAGSASWRRTGRSLAERINSAVAESDDDLVIVLHAGDRLRARRCTTSPSRRTRDPLVDLLTWTTTSATPHGRPAPQPAVPTSWSPEMLLGANYHRPGPTPTTRPVLLGPGPALANRAIGGMRPRPARRMHWGATPQLRSDSEPERSSASPGTASVARRRVEPVAAGPPSASCRSTFDRPGGRRRARRPRRRHGPRTPQTLADGSV
jgi:hypothetical protein